MKKRLDPYACPLFLWSSRLDGLENSRSGLLLFFFDERPEMRSAGTVPVCFFSRERPEMLFICAKIFVYL